MNCTTIGLSHHCKLTNDSIRNRSFDSSLTDNMTVWVKIRAYLEIRIMYCIPRFCQKITLPCRVLRYSLCRIVEKVARHLTAFRDQHLPYNSLGSWLHEVLRNYAHPVKENPV